jgi:Na+(H+)/acetate symporter ActP
MTFWMVRDSGMDERISRDWMLLMIFVLILYLMLVLMLALAMLVLLAMLVNAPSYEATDEDAEVPLAPEASETGAEIVTESAEAPKVLGADEVKEVNERMR